MGYTILEILIWAKEKLQSSETPGLDASILLSHVLKQPKIYLHTHPEKLLSQDQVNLFQDLLTRRLAGEPIAYLINKKDFWTFSLTISPAVLIPRPETELLVELALRQTSPKQTILDWGTGSGAIAIAIALERPNWEIWAIDNSITALEIAKKNARDLKANNIKFLQSNNFSSFNSDNFFQKFDQIIANPPYISPNDRCLSQLKFEPQDALVAKNNGLAYFPKIISEAYKFLTPEGILLLEHGYTQAEIIQQYLTQYHYHHIKTFQDLNNKDRVTLGEKDFAIQKQNACIEFGRLTVNS